MAEAEQQLENQQQQQYSRQPQINGGNCAEHNIEWWRLKTAVPCPDMSQPVPVYV